MIDKRYQMTKDSLKVWIMPTQVGSRTGKLFSRAVASFRKSHPAVSLELRVLPWSNAWAELMRAFKRGDPPDVVQVGSSWMGTLAHLGHLSQVPDGMETRQVVAPWIDECVTLGNRRLGIPWVVECSGLIARADILDGQVGESDIDQWDGFLGFCRKLGENANKQEIDPRRPLPLGITCRPEPVTLHNLAPWLMTGGWNLGALLASNSSRLLSHPSSRPGLECLGELLRVNRTDEDSGAIQPYRLSMDFYQEGRFAFLIGNPWMIVRNLVDPTASVESRWPVTFLPIPAGPAGPATRGGGSVLAVPTRSKKPELAWKLVRHMCSTSFMDIWCQNSGDLPAHVAGFWNRHGDNPELARMRKALEAATNYPAHPMWTTIERVLASGLSDILWSLLAGESLDDHGMALAATVDEEIQSILRIGWDRPT
ncbi:MAG: extracellular solute-binding protein [Fibrobacteres bacterium]|nr:extracellular solute-binding protein [Fibrobacterota bacterium]